MLVNAHELAAWVLKNEEFSNELSLIDEGVDEVANEILDFVTSATPKATEAFKALGLWADDNTIHFDPAKYDEIEALTKQIIREYDGEGDSPLWDAWELSSDDDVDYNGGYIATAIDILRAYVNRTT